MLSSLPRYYSDLAGAENASKYQTGIYLAGSATAEFVADIFLCPFEAVKVRILSLCLTLLLADDECRAEPPPSRHAGQGADQPDLGCGPWRRYAEAHCPGGLWRVSAPSLQCGTSWALPVEFASFCLNLVSRARPTRSDAPSVLSRDPIRPTSRRLYRGLTSLWGRQIPYTMMKFASFEKTVVALYECANQLSDPRKRGPTRAGVALFASIIEPCVDLQARHPEAEGAVLEGRAARCQLRRRLHRRCAIGSDTSLADA